jgi:hypothetical protein
MAKVPLMSGRGLEVDVGRLVDGSDVAAGSTAEVVGVAGAGEFDKVGVSPPAD